MSGVSCTNSISSSGGLERTAARITQASNDFDEKATALVNAAQSTPAPDQSADLAHAATSMIEQKIVNQMLYATFQVQAEQQRSIANTLTGST